MLALLLFLFRRNACGGDTNCDTENDDEDKDEDATDGVNNIPWGSRACSRDTDIEMTRMITMMTRIAIRMSVIGSCC